MAEFAVLIFLFTTHIKIDDKDNSVRKRKKDMTKKGRLLSNIVVLGLGAVLSKLATFFMMPVYTAYLTPADFGTADIVVNTAVLLLPLVSFGAPEAVFRFVAGGYDEGVVVAVGKKFLKIGFTILMIVLPFLAFFEILRPYLLHLFCYVLFSVLHGFASHLLRARGQYGLYAVQQVFCTLMTVTLAFLLLSTWNMGVGGYLTAIFLSDALTALIILIYASRNRGLTAPNAENGLLATMLRYAVPLIPTATLWWILAVSDHYILLFFHGEVQTGLYAAAGKLPALLTFAAGVFLEAWHFAAIREKEEDRKKLFERIYGSILPALILFVVVLILFSRLLVEIVFATEFERAALYVPLLSVAAMFSALSSFLGSVYVVKLRSGASLLTALIGGAVNVVLDLIWIPSYGAIGAMSATLISYITVFLWRAAHCYRVMPFCQHLGKLTFSVVLLVLASLLMIDTRTAPAVTCGLLSLLPFWHEINGSVRFLIDYGKKYAVFRQKIKK